MPIGSLPRRTRSTECLTQTLARSPMKKNCLENVVDDCRRRKAGQYLNNTENTTDESKGKILGFVCPRVPSAAKKRTYRELHASRVSRNRHKKDYCCVLAHRHRLAPTFSRPLRIAAPPQLTVDLREHDL